MVAKKLKMPVTVNHSSDEQIKPVHITELSD